MTQPNAIPKGYHSVTPYLVVQGVANLIDFLKQAFDAENFEKISGEDGSIMHAEVRIGDSVVMMGEAGGEWKPMPSWLYLYVTDADAVYSKAIQAGATSISEPKDEFYGDRTGSVKDPSGNCWTIATRKENLTMDEITKRAQAHAKA
jgi:PhnB protein